MACVSGLTNGVYSYVDCCGLLQTGVSLGQSICLDESFTGTSFGVYIATGQTCTQDCNQGTLSYSFQVSGVCDTGLGTVEIAAFGGIPGYTMDPVTPLGSGLSAQTGNGSFTFTGLTGGTYVFRLNDSQGLQNNELYINTIISNCFVANVYNVSGSTCGVSNGYVNITATTSASPYTVIVYKDGGVFDVSTSPTFPVTYSNLSYGVYYATVFDYGSVTANTENFVINESVGVDFGFWKVNTSNCVIDKGKLAVTGLTGTGPYTFLWSNNETDQLITGLTQGTYSVTVTDSLGCSTTKSEVIGAADPIGLGFLDANNPSCFSNDGSLTFTLTGGTVPFYYSASTYEVGYTLSDTFTISNLAGGAYQVFVRDANFCNVMLNGTLNSVNGFNVVDIATTQSSCNQTSGKIKIDIEGANNYYTYAISGLTTNNTNGVTTQSQTHTFTDLSNDTYLLVISGAGTNCSYSEFITISSVEKFQVNYTATTASCALNNGTISIEVGTGYTGVLDYVLSDGQSIIDTPSTAYTFSNLVSGQYTLSVTDNENCTVTKDFEITTTGELAFIVNAVDCTGTNDGSASVIVNKGNPTFNYEWSDNVPGNPTGSTVTGLSGGTYTVVVIDSNGCSNKQTFDILCGNSNIVSYQIVNLCVNEFNTSSGNKRGFSEMLNEGFLDLSNKYTNCVLSSATFNCNIDINGSAYTQSFYTTTNFSNVPSDALWQTTIESILSSISEIGSYNVNLVNNTLQINSNCDGDSDPLGGKPITIELEIDYTLNCESSGNTMCFSYSSDTMGYKFEGVPIGINNNRPYYFIDDSGFTAYVYWNDVYNVWVFSQHLNDNIENAYSILDNFYNASPESDMTYLWEDGGQSGSYKMGDSAIGSCP